MDTIETPARAMVVAPHPDDGESGCSGTTAKWIREGCEVVYVVCTNGDKGTSDVEMTPAKLAGIREEEQRKAAEILGVKDVVFLGHGDGELENNLVFIGELVHAIRRFKPDTILTTDPHRMETHNHRDHRATGQAVLDACFPYARDRLHFVEHEKEGLEPHKVGTVLLWGADRPDVMIDISDSIEAKLTALMQHVSQVGDSYSDVAEWVKAFGRRAADRAKGTGYEYAEAFRKLTFRR
jgi:LmbE family N-acetylglucosaminyl deacetylase